MSFLLQNLNILLFMLLLLFFSGFFSSSESAFFSISKEELEGEEESRKRIDKVIISLLKSPSNLLVSVLLGNLTVNILFFSFSTVVGIKIGREYGEIYQFIFGIIILFILLIFGEIIPKSLGIKVPLKIASLFAIPMKIWISISAPFGNFITKIVTKLFALQERDNTGNKINREELKFILDLSEKRGAIGGNISDIIEDILLLSLLRAKHVMTPRIDIEQFPFDRDIKEAMAYAKEKRIAILPIYQGSSGNLIGYLDVKNLLLYGDNDISGPIKNYMNKAIYYPETKILSDLLLDMHNNDYRVAFLVDEYGDIVGVVYREYIIKNFIFDTLIPNENNQLKIEKIDDNKYRISANLPFYEWKEFFSSIVGDIGSYNFASIGGFVLFLLGRIPKEGEKVYFNNLVFIIEKVKRHRILTLVVEITDS